MKKLALILAILVATTALSALELDFLGTALYTGDLGSESNDSFSMSDFIPGGELRIKAGPLRADATCIVVSGDEETALLLPLDLGLSLDLLFCASEPASGRYIFIRKATASRSSVRTSRPRSTSSSGN